MENVKLVEEKKGKCFLRLHLGEPKPSPSVVGNLKPATMSDILRHPLYGGKEFSDYTGGKPTKSPVVFVESSQTDKKASLVN